MKLKDLIREEIDIDVYDDYDERCGMAIVGPIVLTEEGKSMFSNLLELSCQVYDSKSPYGYHAVVHTDTEDEAEALRLFVLATAGYVSDSDFRKWFKED